MSDINERGDPWFCGGLTPQHKGMLLQWSRRWGGEHPHRGKGEEGEVDSDIYLEIMGKKIYLKKPTKEFDKYDKIESTGKFINRNLYYEKIDKDIVDDKETIINKAVELMKNSINKEISKQSKIVDNIITTEDLGEGKIRLKVLFVVEQNIALSY